MNKTKKTNNQMFKIRLKLRLSSLYPKLPINQRIKKMNYSSKCLSLARMMPFTWVLYILELLHLNQLMLFSILGLNIWLSLVVCVMTRPLANIDLKSLILHLKPLLKETKRARDARLWLTTCKNQKVKKFSQRHLQS